MTHRTDQPDPRRRRPDALLCVVLALAAGCQDGTDARAAPVAAGDASGAVRTGWGEAVAGAVVYLVPADRVPTTPITAADVLSGAAEAYDEPLEDVVESAAARGFPQAVTRDDGTFAISGVDVLRSYFVFVAADRATPAGLYPGGSLSRVARGGFALRGMEIALTGHPSETSRYVGSSTCLTCHADLYSQRTHAHRLGLRRPGRDGPLQSLSGRPDFDAGLASFKLARAGDFKSAATSLWFHAYDGTRDADKFAVSTTDPGGASIRVYLWQDAASGRYQVTMQNLARPADPDRTYAVDLTYGGALSRQLYLLAVPGRAGRYPFLQFQHAGDDGYYDRTRKAWRDVYMDRFWDAARQELVLPDKADTFEATCLACHATGYRAFDAPTGERLARAVDDISGAFDIDGDSTPDEINTGCEVCHGPGGEHVGSASARFIVNPRNLSPGREAQLCGRCHDRVAGNDDRKNGQPLDASGSMAPPGIRRAEFLARYTSRKGPVASDLWVDQVHSRSSQQQYADFIRSAHYRNDRRLVVCSDCHDMHRTGSFGDLRADPADGSLCSRCHAFDLTSHVVAKTGSVHFGDRTPCTGCHFYPTARSGAGRRGLLLGTPSGSARDADITYWENDIRSHLPGVPGKENPGVRGVVPGEAMPVPYTNRCATCHDASSLKNPR